MTKYAAPATTLIQRPLGDFKPTLGIMLGSGLGGVADLITQPTAFPYTELPGFPACTVKGHQGQLLCGYLNDIPVACLQGRSHGYEGTDPQVTQTMIRTLKLLGCQSLVITNAVGAVNPNFSPGDLILVTDHINFQFHNPLVGPNADEFGPRFIGLETLYNLELQQKLNGAADELNINLASGVYLGTLGPSFETPAEIRAFRLLGADIVGMSLIPEAITAHHCGISVAAISVVTNLAAGLSQQTLTHDITLQGAAKGAESLQQLLLQFTKNGVTC